MKYALIAVLVGLCGCGFVCVSSTGRNISVGLREDVLEQRTGYVPNGHLSMADANRLAVFQQASISGDNSQVAAMVEALDHPPHRAYQGALPHMLARLGAIPALRVLSTYIKQNPDSTRSNVAKAAIARIQAEAAVQGQADGPAKAGTKVRLFLQGLGLTTDDLNAALAAQGQPRIGNRGRLVIVEGGWGTSIGVAAVDEIADMAYYGSSQDYAQLPELSQINFQADYPAALKMRLAPLTHDDRIKTMVDELAVKTVLRGEDRYEVQLLANMGKAGSEAAAARIREMKAGKAPLFGAGCGALIQVIAAVGDTGQLPLVDGLQKDTNMTIANCAYLASNSLHQGSNNFQAPGY